jgi:hypothetical protein
MGSHHTKRVCMGIFDSTRYFTDLNEIVLLESLFNRGCARPRGRAALIGPLMELHSDK